MASDARTPTRPNRLRARERDRRALELRIGGLTFAAIGAEMGVSWQAAQQAVKRSLEITKADIAEKAAELRAIEAERLDKVTEVLWPRVLQGDLRAIDRLLRTRESYRRLTGLDIDKAAPAMSVGTFVLGAGTTAEQISQIPPGATVVDARPPWERDEAETLTLPATTEDRE
jgi:hypothetical protein